MKLYLGIDVGAVTTKFALLDEGDELVAKLYLRTQGEPVALVQRGLEEMASQLPPRSEIAGVGATGSARYLAGALVGADLVKNEVTSHAVAAVHLVPGVQTVIEIGGQDSKVIIIRRGLVADFGMNTVCAAGTGSFLDHQAQRLGLSIEEFGERSLRSQRPVPISGRCTVFAESDMIHKQQTGHSTDDIIYGLCQALVRNYLSNVALGKELLPPVVFQGGVAFNRGIVRALEESLESPVLVPPHHEVMGAVGVALLVHEEMDASGKPSGFQGFEVSQRQYRTLSFECEACPSKCEIHQVSGDGRVLARWGGRCELWERTPVN